jgi:lysophospholipase L1-like esterase
MLSSKKTIFWLSLGFNAISIVILATLLIRNGEIDRLVRRIPWLNNSTTKAVENDRPRVGYYQMRKTLFAGLPDGKTEIILLGDSLTDHGEWTELLNDTRIINRGISGDTTDGVLNRLEEIIASKPVKIFVLIGINDIWNEQKNNDAIAANYRKILETIQEKIPKTEVYIQSLLPINTIEFQVNIDSQQIIELNQELKKLATEFNYYYVDLYQHFVDDRGQLQAQYTNDGLHLTAAGYILWAKQIKNLVD